MGRASFRSRGLSPGVEGHPAVLGQRGAPQSCGTESRQRSVRKGWIIQGLVASVWEGRRAHGRFREKKRTLCLCPTGLHWLQCVSAQQGSHDNQPLKRLRGLETGVPREARRTDRIGDTFLIQSQRDLLKDSKEGVGREEGPISCHWLDHLKEDCHL